MILVDANLLLIAYQTNAPRFECARTWLEGTLNGTERVGLPWPSLLAFLRISTNPRIFRPALDPARAWSLVLRWLAFPHVWIPCPTDRHAEILAKLLLENAVSANLVMDAHLAAIAIEHGLMICTSDGDFARFKGLRWTNPLA